MYCTVHLILKTDCAGYRGQYVWQFPPVQDFGMRGIRLLSKSTVETVVLMSIKDRKPDTHINVSLDMDDYHRIIGDEKPEA